MDIIVGGCILLILGSSFRYVQKQIRSGSPCMGCSQGKNCGSCPSHEE